MSEARSALITGASRGIGLMIAERLAAQGYALTISARTQSDVDRIAANLTARHGVSAQGVAADLSRTEELPALVAAHERRFSSMDALVLSGGMGLLGGVERLNHDRLSEVLRVNFFSALQLFQSALPALRAAAERVDRRGARVIALASILGVHSEPKLGGYAASKAAVRSLVETINLEHSAEGISATAICPAYVATDMTAWLKDSIPQTDMLAGDDLAELAAALLLLSRQAVVNEIVVSRAGTDGRIP